MVSVMAGLELLVLAHEEEFEEVAKKLEGYVFEGKGRAMEELEEVERLPLVEGDDRAVLWVAECGVASLDYLVELDV